MQKNIDFQLVYMGMEAIEQILSLQKDGDGGFATIPVTGSVANIFIKRNEIFQQNFLINFKAVFNVS